MTRRPLVLLSTLALIWGASFMFIKIADRQVAPSTLILGRLSFATVTLAIAVPFMIGGRTTLAELRAHWRWLVVVGLVNTAIPFWLLSWGETRIDSGLASIIQGSVPIFNALLAFSFFRNERVTGRRLLGVAIGFVGVALLVGAQPQGKVLAALAVVAMALCYAAGGLLTRRHLATARPHAIALGTAAVAALAAAPAGIAQAPGHLPSGETFAALAVLGVLGTALAYLLMFTIIARAGAGYASLVTYLVPPVALFYGAVFESEGIGWPAIVGLVLILGGVALGTGVSRRKAATRASSPSGALPAEP
ncbi:MAG TPA: DMT family transporter [Gaiellaceae bacterium]|nr:DMT family transporter [Gaiellaceae bacterium]